MHSMNRVLLIDDDPDIRAVAELGLSAVGGFEVLLAGGGEEGVAMAARERPELIILDVMMPGLDGPTTLARLKALDATARIPVIFMTARVQRHELASYLSLGAIGVIDKPFDPITLAEQVRAIATPAMQHGDAS